MLLITRQVGERIRIGEQIVIKLHHVGKTQILLGVRAPEALKIGRVQPRSLRAAELPAE